MNDTRKRVITRIICLLSIVFLLLFIFILSKRNVTSVKPVEEKPLIEIELDWTYVGVFADFNLRYKDTIITKDSVPNYITFFFKVKNNGDQPFYFHTDLRFYLMGIEPKDSILGEFLMIHDTDTIVLSCSGTRLVEPGEERQARAVLGGGHIMSFYYDKHDYDGKNPLVEAPTDVRGYKKYLFDYVKTSRFIYIPNEKRYQQKIAERREDCNYPRHIIEVKIPDPLILYFSRLYIDEDDDDNDTVGRLYPYSLDTTFVFNTAPD